MIAPKPRQVNTHRIVHTITPARRLAALEALIRRTRPTVARWARLHAIWRELEPDCDTPQLKRTHARIGRLLGGERRPTRAAGSGSQNVKGQFSGRSLPENCLRSGLPLTGKEQDKIGVAVKAQRFDGLPSGERPQLKGGI